MIKVQNIKQVIFIWIILFTVSIKALSMNRENLKFINASNYGFSPDSSGISNTKALQYAVDNGGSIYISNPGVYKIAGTVYLTSNTSLYFGNNVFLKKVDEAGIFTHVFLNKGALSKTYDKNIVIDGLQLIVNQVDKRFGEVYGLRGQIAFHYIRDLKIERFRCLDLATKQYCIHICTFEDITLNDIVIKGDKDGIHLGKGKRFSITNSKFQTVDDAIALNAWDWVISNPELGWIENGIIENCYDLNDEKKPIAFFCRILAGSWKNWKNGMDVQLSDIVVSDARIYRVVNIAEGKFLKSDTKPSHEKGTLELDGITWLVTQYDTLSQAGVRNIVFRDIFLEKPRIAFSFHFDNGTHRSYYPGAQKPVQENFLFDNIRVQHNIEKEIFTLYTPVNLISIINSSLKNNSIVFKKNSELDNYGTTIINLHSCNFRFEGKLAFLKNHITDKKILFQTSNSLVLNTNFELDVVKGDSEYITIDSDLLKH